MTRLQKTYHITAIVMLVLHCVMFGFILLGNFLPLGNWSYALVMTAIYKTYFGEGLGSALSCLSFLLPLAAAVLAGVSIRYPATAIWIPVCTGIFFAPMILLWGMGWVLAQFMASWIGGSSPDFYPLIPLFIIVILDFMFLILGDNQKRS